MSGYVKRIEDAMKQMVENGASPDHLMIVTSIPYFQPYITFFTAYGRMKVKYEPMLPNDTFYIIHNPEAKVMDERKPWHTYFLDLAELAATRSTCNRLKVGCVLVRGNKVLSTGYNGSIKGHPHCTDVGCLENEAGRCIRTIHAEQNAIIQAACDLTNAIAYVTHEPCETCTKLLNQAGITKVVYRKPYRNGNNHAFFRGMHWVSEGYLDAKGMKE